MSKLKISGNASGTGVVTLTAPNTNTDRTITLPDGDISLGVGIADNATSTAITIDVSGNTTVNTGNLVIGTSGKGIDFSATANGSGTTTSEVLDDYEEGTWTPTVAFGSYSVGVTYANQYGSYTKVGNRVTASCYVSLTSKGTSVGVIRITNLPFAHTSIANSYTTGTIWMNVVSFADSPQGYIPPNTSSFEIYELSSTGAESSITNVNAANTSAFMINVSYRV